MSDDLVFKALADPTRRRLLDRLFAGGGRTLSELESDVDMTRFGVMKHLRLLEEAGLITTRRRGREKLHFLNAVPIRLVHDRWIDKYTEPGLAALVHLKHTLENPVTTVQVHRVYIKATPEAIWTAIVDPEWSTRYGYRGVVDYDLRPGGVFKTLAGDHMPGIESTACVVEGEVIESDPPRRLVQTWRPTWLDEPVTRLTYEIAEGDNGVCSLTLTHDVDGAPQTGAQVAGEVENAGGGWPQVLSDLKTLLETGTGLYS
ncbi:ArsR/SmtB family transcription factor [Actinokineospora terrae]|uniref:ArsR/SmtB family transcription factor n=1 Tax=Actinokineospora terrae TaxID=155974 RepID=UPI000B88AE4A|nr:metalloregulator ArsR/SmtB family transcription factor [Actinokineospora terrae]